MSQQKVFKHRLEKAELNTERLQETLIPIQRKQPQISDNLQTTQDHITGINNGMKDLAQAIWERHDAKWNAAQPPTIDAQSTPNPNIQTEVGNLQHNDHYPEPWISSGSTADTSNTTQSWELKKKEKRKYKHPTNQDKKTEIETTQPRILKATLRDFATALDDRTCWFETDHRNMKTGTN